MIVQLGFAERELVERVVEAGSRSGVPLGQALIEAGVVDSGQVAQALAERNGLDYVDLNVFDVDKGATSMIDGNKARRYRTIPIAFLAERTLLVATADPANLLALDDITMATGYEVRRAVASPEDIDALIENLGTLAGSVHEIEEEVEAEVIELRESADEAPVVKLVHAVIADAVRRGASDIHFEPRANDMRVRFRVDGVVFDSTTVPRHLTSGLVSRIKIMAELDIAEKRAPQDGRIGLSVDGHFVDLRVATLPVVRGESVVMRILDSRQAVMDLDRLGMGEADRARFENAIGATHGAILVTGPTGSGKTTTLYAGVDDAQHAESDDRDRGGPGRVRDRGGQADPDELEDGPHLRHRPAGDRPGRPGRDHGRRGTRRRHGPDRDRVGPHRAPGAHHAARERCAARGRTADRHGHRALPGDLERGVRGRPAARALPVRVQGPPEGHEDDAQRERLRLAARLHRLRARGLRALRAERLQGPHRRSTRS